VYEVLSIFWMLGLIAVSLALAPKQNLVLVFMSCSLVSRGLLPSLLPKVGVVRGSIRAWRNAVPVASLWVWGFAKH
jgi:hypothetical protein